MKVKKILNSGEYDALLEFIMSSLMKNGLKATTMDSIAASRQMSKRTLYEIFSDKETMFREVHSYFTKKYSETLKEIFTTSENVMEGIIRCFLYNRDMMNKCNVEFMRDLNNYYSEQLNLNQKQLEQNQIKKMIHLHDVLKEGMEEGFIRNDVNLLVQCRMLIIQMESLKRMEEYFPEDITLIEAFDNIILSFLRGLSTSRGLEEIERLIPLMKTNENKIK